MNVNVHFHGAVEKILDEAVRKGYASTKTEALRLGVFELNNRYQLLERTEDEEDIKCADAVMERVSNGKERLYSEAQVLAKLK
ncbi:hypothetical protein AUJ65_06030 [Candidatus Micrarchaeota archaeon CG1_02_51_15]|nr:MAG: hypothetical protein AUJ65_06030 [Candidatus Micrarchaeota archaeon CG1_02_51_15]